MTQILIRRGTAATWTSNNPVLGLGEIGYETDTKKAKMGDGSTTWNSLGYWHPTMPTGEVVGTTDAQAITNKDLSSTVNPNTFPTRLQRQVTTITSPTTLGSSYGENVVQCSVASTDPHFGKVALLLSGDGANNSTTITDSSLATVPVTTFGNAKLNTTTKKFGTASISFDGVSGTCVVVSTRFDFPADFAVEFWIYFNSVTGTPAIIDGRPGTASSGPYIYLGLDSSNIILYTNSVVAIRSSTVSTGQWYHVALTRSGTSTRLFINGTQSGSTYTDTTAYAAPYFVLGYNQQNGLSMNAFMDDLRVTKGTARYTTTFTAPTAAFPGSTSVGTPTLPTAVGNTSSYLIKNTLTAASITIGTTSAQTIDGAASTALGPGSSLRVESDGSNWLSSLSSDLTGKTISGLTNTITNVPTSALTLSGAATAFVGTNESTTSTSFVDLPTTSDQVTVTIGSSGVALVTMNCFQYAVHTSFTYSVTSFAVSGATTRAADAYRYAIRGNTVGAMLQGGSWLVTGLNSGSTTFKMKYAAEGGTSYFSSRTITVVPL